MSAEDREAFDEWFTSLSDGHAAFDVWKRGLSEAWQAALAWRDRQPPLDPALTCDHCHGRIAKCVRCDKVFTGPELKALAAPPAPEEGGAH